MSIDVSVVIPAYNREKYLTKCLDCLFAQDYAPDCYEVIVVDDASTDGTEEMVRTKNPACGFKYLRQPQNMGTGAAKNRGIEAAEGSIVVFTDSDAFAPSWYIREYADSHKAYPHAIVDGPAITIRDERLIDDPPLYSPKVKALAALDFFGQAFVNANAACPREDLLKAGGFDVNFKRWQDLELCQRLMKLGLKRIRNRRAYVLHYEADRGNVEDIGKHMEKSGRYAAMFYTKHPSAWARRKTRLRYLTYDAIFQRLGLDLTPENIERGGPSRLLEPLYVIHAYAEGLRAGLASSTEAGGG